jgi:hypothetical protein
MEAWVPRNHSGCKVATTNQMANKTVTHCENKDQIRFILQIVLDSVAWPCFGVESPSDAMVFAT